MAKPISPEDIEQAKASLCDLIDQLAESGRLSFSIKRGIAYDRSHPTSLSPGPVPTGEVVLLLHNCQDETRAKWVLADA